MKIILLQTGKTSDKFVKEGIEVYSARIKRYSPFEIVTVPDLKDTRNMPVGEQKLREGRKIMEFLMKDDFVVLLDEKGKEMRTTEFAGWLEKRITGSLKRLIFVIGGPWGFSDDVSRLADMNMSLSKMTFPHQLVRLLFMEQLYRAFTVIKGEPYHHE